MIPVRPESGLVRQTTWASENYCMRWMVGVEVESRTSRTLLFKISQSPTALIT